jgi:alkaline phosphatase D
MRRPLALAAAAATTAFAVYGVWLMRRRHLARSGRVAFHRGALELAIAPGLTGPHGVRLWGRSPSHGPHELLLEERASGREVARVEFDVPEGGALDGTWALEYPGDFAGAPRLEPVTRYSFSVRALGSEACGQGYFETAPVGSEDTPQRFAFAVMSCHLPFDKYGELSDSACRLLEQLPDALDSWNVKRTLMLGDQMYGDYPENCSLFNQDYFRSLALPGRESVLDCTREEVRRLYQERHRIFWKHGGFNQLQARFPCHMILDDHEIVDNFGTPTEHSEPRYKNLRAGALDAFYDYQGARGLARQNGARPEAFYQSFEYGTVAAFVMDLRSERRVVSEQIEVCSEAQWQALLAFLGQHRDKHVLFIGLSVPLLHVPDWLATTGTALGADDGDVADRWTNPKMQASRDRLLHLIREHQHDNPRQRLVLLGGDVHVGAASRFAWSDDMRDSYQLIASALSNREGFLLRGLVELIPKIGAVIGHDGTADFSGELLGAAKNHACDGDPSNPYGKLNVGVIEVERISADESSVRLLLLGCEDEGEPKVKVVFDSGRL